MKLSTNERLNPPAFAMYWFEKSTLNIPVFHDDRFLNFRKVRHNSARIWGNNRGFKSLFFKYKHSSENLALRVSTKYNKGKHTDRNKCILSVILSNI